MATVAAASDNAIPTRVQYSNRVKWVKMILVSLQTRYKQYTRLHTSCTHHRVYTHRTYIPPRVHIDSRTHHRVYTSTHVHTIACTHRTSHHRVYTPHVHTIACTPHVTPPRVLFVFTALPPVILSCYNTTVVIMTNKLLP